MKPNKADSFDIDASHGTGRGFSILTATVFIIGEVAGGGILSLPHAVSLAGWSGLIMILYCALCAGIAGLCLAECWIILEERYPQYRKGLTRKPFATIGHHAYGPYMSVFVSVLMNVTRIGATAVFVLLSANLIVSLTESFTNLGICQWTPIVSAILLVPMWLGSPVDFWPMAYSAMFSTVVGSVLLIVAIVLEIHKNGLNKDYHVEGFESFSSAFGIILFAFGGASAFPNFQNDMKEKDKFPKAVIFGFTGLIMLYVPTAALGYGAFGFHSDYNIISNLGSSVIITIIQICFLVHSLTVVLIIVNPVFLDLEELFKISKTFNWKRCFFRTILLIFVTFLGETFPNFGQILDLIGGSTITIMAFVLPPIFYMKLCNDKHEDWPERNVPLHYKIIFAIIIASGIAGGISSSFSTIKNWQSLETACYVNPHANNSMI